ncbi:MAG: MBL fold metallo-hydrolase [Acidimicrobiia bacterium]|nr:MBL fold metallo-hydrolase [Acidimicrobiia bacterium]
MNTALLLMQVAAALGAGDLHTIQYSGSGFTYVFGQSYQPGGAYPKFRLTYTRAIDFDARASREQVTRTQFEEPPRGGGNQPLYREVTGATLSTDATPWGAGTVTLTPHGFVNAALANAATVRTVRTGGRTLTVVSFTGHRGFKVEGYVNAQHLIERIDTWVQNPILGETRIETTYADYRPVAGITFPMRIVQRQGGFPTLELTVSDVRPNATVDIPAPAPAVPARAEGHRIADGVWYLTGAPEPNSQLVEMRDYAVLIESSISEARAAANIAEARRLVPGKPIRYHVNSHHHADHAGGLRAYVSAGITLVTHEMNRRLYERPGLATAGTVWVKDRYVLDDGSRRLEIHHVPNGHAANLLMSYLPRERLLMVTDVFNDFGEPRPNDPPPGLVSPYYAALGERIRALKLDVERIAPSHGRDVVPAERLRKALEGTVQSPLRGRSGSL